MVLAVSGGPDSMGLLELFLEFRAGLGVDLIVAHLNHGIRGAEAERDQESVREVAGSRGLPFIFRQIDWKTLTLKNNVEAQARRVRYEFLREVAEEYGARKVATGHTLDDQAETVLMRFLTEGGRRASGGIPPVREGLFIRPLLEITKDEILSYLREKGLSYSLDSTNADLRYLRNRIRHKVIPMLIEEVNPNLKQRLATVGRVLRVEDEYMDQKAREALGAMVLGDGVLDLEGFRKAPDALKPRMLRIWMGPESRSETVHLDALLSLVESGKDGSVSLPGGFAFSTDANRGRVCPGGEKVEPLHYEYVVAPGSELWIEHLGARVQTEVTEGQVSERVDGKDPFTEFFDLDRMQGTLLVRNRERGDRIRPLGMRGRKLLSDLFIDRKLPRAIRDELPILVCGGEIQWVPGCARSDSALIGSGSTRVLRVTLAWPHLSSCLSSSSIGER